MSTGPNGDLFMRSLNNIYSNLLNNIDNSFLDELRESGRIEEI